MKSIFSIFKRGLEKTTTRVARTIGSIFTGVKAHSAATFDELEELLISADFGVPAGDLPVRENESGVFAAPDRQRQFPFQRDDPGLAARSCKHKSQHESNPTR